MPSNLLHLEWRNLDLVWELYCELSSTQLELQLGGKTSDHLLALCTIAVRNRQQYTNPRLSAFMIKLQYHFLPLKLGLRSDKARSTKSLPPIHLMYVLMAWGCDAFTLPLPRFYCFTFPIGSTFTALLPIVTTLLFHQISSIWSPNVMYWYSPLSIFLNSSTHFNGQPFVLSARKVPLALKPFSERVSMSWYDETLSKKHDDLKDLAQGKSDNVTIR